RNVRQGVAVVGKKVLLGFEVRPHGAQPLSDVGMQSGLDERYLPILHVDVQWLDLLETVREDEVVGSPFGIVDEVVLDQIAAVSQAKYEFGVSEMSVVAHEMPDDRTVTDVHERFRNRVRMFPKPLSQSTKKQDNLHEPSSCAAFPTSHYR